MRRLATRSLTAGMTAGLLLLAGCGSGEPDSSATARPNGTAGLPDECTQWADVPETDQPIEAHTHVTNAVWEKVDGYIDIDMNWTNETQLVAVDVTVDVLVLLDGKDITDELPQTKELTALRPYGIDVMLPQPVAAERGEVYIIPDTVTLDDLPANPDWAESGGADMTLEATPVVTRWCVLKEVNQACPPTDFSHIKEAHVGELAQHLDELTIRALSPDKRIRAILKGRDQAAISFAHPEEFRQYSNGTTVCEQTSELLNRIYRGLRQGRDQVIDRHSRLDADTRPHWDAAVRRMYADLDNLAVDGASQSGLVRVEAIGLHDWRVRIRPGAFESMTAAQFCAGVNGCVRDAYRKYLSAMRSMKSRALHGLELDNRHD